MSEIKLLFCALTGCTSPKTVHTEIGPCTPQYIVMIISSKNISENCAPGHGNMRAGYATLLEGGRGSGGRGAGR